jgi:hypothetical protein
MNTRIWRRPATLIALLVAAPALVAETALQTSVNSAIQQYVEQLQDGQYQEVKVEIQNLVHRTSGAKPPPAQSQRRPADFQSQL